MNRLHVAIQGEAGSNSHAAAEELLGEQQIVPCSVSVEVFSALKDAVADVAVLPIENSLHGSVTDHYDLLLKSDVAILAEISLRIHHALIAVPGVQFSEIKRVLSHPVALSQCRLFFAEHPQIAAVPFYDTAGAVKHLMSERPAGEAAIARDGAAAVYGAQILQAGLEDDPKNFTRFFLLAPSESAERYRRNTPVDKMSIAFALEHRPGSLVEALQRLAGLGADLTRIESRPVAGKPWEYVFYVDLRFTGADKPDAILAALKSVCHTVTELGRYTAAA